LPDGGGRHGGELLRRLAHPVRLHVRLDRLLHELPSDVLASSVQRGPFISSSWPAMWIASLSNELIGSVAPGR
jgi:hypothetical protein